MNTRHALSTQKRQLLELRMKQKGLQKRKTAAIMPRQESATCPLSFAQQRLWFFDQMEPQSTAYLIPCTRRLYGSLNLPALENSLTLLIQRHESLRTTFRLLHDQPVQVIHQGARFCLPIIDLSTLPAKERIRAEQRLATQEKRQPCNLEQGPLFRAHLMRVESETHTLLMTLHHIISDAWSNELLLRELSEVYHALSANRPCPLEPLPIQYADFALWQRQWLQDHVLQTQSGYWHEQLADVTPLHLPTDYPRPTSHASQGKFLSIEVPGQLWQQLTTISQQEGATQFMLLLAAFQILLSRYSGQADICVGTVIANRPQPDLEKLIGFFANTLVLRTDLSGHPTFREVLQRAREVALGAYAHQDMPFEQLVEDLHPERNIQQHPLFQVTLRLHYATSTTNTQHQSAPETKNSFSDEQQTAAKFDLSLVITETSERIVCGMTYNTSLFAQNTVERLLQHWIILLQGIATAPETPIATLPLLSEAERVALLHQSHAPSASLPQPTNLASMLWQQVERSPEACALIYQEQTLSYAALWQRVRYLANRLYQSGVRPYDRVALWMPRSPEGLQGLLAIWLVGGVLLPLDPTAPALRIQNMLHMSDACLLMTNRSLLASLTTEQTTVLPVVLLEEDLNEGRVFTEAAGEHWEGRDLQGTDPACLLYTSGSTGIPKGVLLSQQALLNRLCWGIRQVEMKHGERLAQIATWSFDIALWELIAPLLCGASVVLLPAALLQESVGLLRWLQEEGITLLHVVPSLLRILVREEELAQARNLRWILCGGEAVPQWLLQQVRERLPVGLQQYYGPTEAAISVTCWQVESEEELGRVTLGRPITNTQVYVLDRRSELVPIGVYGELVLGGVAIADGYPGEAEQTARQFVPDPYSGVAGARLYRTGDRGRWLADGELEYGGRQDRQVKLRGQRIEPEGIEAVLEGHQQVRDAIVEVRIVAGEAQLVAYVVRQSGATVTGEQLRAYVGERLPESAIPGEILLLEQLPLTSHGKVNRAMLPEMAQTPLVKEENETEERTPLEELLGALWGELLGREWVGRDEDFFELGGHSLLAMRVVAWIRRVLGTEVGVQALFEAPRLCDFATIVEENSFKGSNPIKGGSYEPIMAVQRKQAPPLSFAQQRLWFLDQLDHDSTAYLIPNAWRLQGTINVDALERSLQELVARHESLRTTFTVHHENPVQVIHPISRLLLPIIDLAGLEQQIRSSSIRQLVRQEAQRPCSLVQGPLLRVYLLKDCSTTYILLATFHHIIADGWSSDIFRRELSILYQAFCQGQPSPLSPLPIQYADFAVWQRSWLQGKTLQRHLTYWRQQLSGATALQLPGDQPSAVSQRSAGYSFRLSEALTRELTSFCKQEHITPFMALLTAFFVLLYRYSGQKDVVVGTDIANRTRAETEGLIGFFVNLLALRADMSELLTLRQLLHSIRRMVLEAYTYQDIPFEMLAEHLRLERKTGGTPLINVLIVLQNMPHSASNPANVTFVPIHDKDVTAKFDLALFLYDRADYIACSMLYRADLFQAQTIATMMRHFEAIVQNIISHPDLAVEGLDISTGTEKSEQAQEKQERRSSLVRNLRASKGKEVTLFADP